VADGFIHAAYAGVVASIDDRAGVEGRVCEGPLGSGGRRGQGDATVGEGGGGGDGGELLRGAGRGNKRGGRIDVPETSNSGL